MKRCIYALLVLAVLVPCASCSKKQELHVYTWADYMNPEIIADFEKSENCRVVLDYFDSNEALYAKVKAGAKGYDLYICSSYMVSIMRSQNMLAAIDRSRIKNIGNIDSEYLKIALDPAMEHSVPYMISFSGIAYNTEKIGDFEPSWTMFDRTDLKGRITLLNDMRETIGAALKLNGYSYNSINDAELEKARQTVMRWKKNIAKFDVDEAKRGLEAGEFFLIHNYNGDALQLIEQNDRLAFAVPREGTSISVDDLVIPVTAPNADLAYRFIEHLLEAEVSAKNMEFISYLAPNTVAQKLMPAEFMANPAIMPSRDIMKKSDVLRDLGAHNAKYTKIWDSIKSGR
jgi:spermidine/putrescine transport system substrate-binding protein